MKKKVLIFALVSLVFLVSGEIFILISNYINDKGQTSPPTITTEELTILLATSEVFDQHHPPYNTESINSLKTKLKLLASDFSIAGPVMVFHLNNLIAELDVLHTVLELNKQSIASAHEKLMQLQNLATKPDNGITHAEVENISIFLKAASPTNPISLTEDASYQIYSLLQKESIHQKIHTEALLKDLQATLQELTVPRAELVSLENHVMKFKNDLDKKISHDGNINTAQKPRPVTPGINFILLSLIGMIILYTYKYFSIQTFYSSKNKMNLTGQPSVNKTQELNVTQNSPNSFQITNTKELSLACKWICDHLCRHPHHRYLNYTDLLEKSFCFLDQLDPQLSNPVYLQFYKESDCTKLIIHTARMTQKNFIEFSYPQTTFDFISDPQNNKWELSFPFIKKQSQIDLAS